MSKKSKQASKEHNRKEKRSKKLAQQAKYDSWRAAGTNQKSSRAKARAKIGKRMARVGRHLEGPCGNEGCSRCNPNTPGNNPFLAPKGSVIYSKRFTSSKWKNKDK